MTAKFDQTTPRKMGIRMNLCANFCFYTKVDCIIRCTIHSGTRKVRHCQSPYRGKQPTKNNTSKKRWKTGEKWKFLQTEALQSICFNETHGNRNKKFRYLQITVIENIDRIRFNQFHLYSILHYLDVNVTGLFVSVSDWARVTRPIQICYSAMISLQR